MLTNKQIAIGKLVDARLMGFTHIELNPSNYNSVFYLFAYGKSSNVAFFPYRFGICALQARPLIPFMVTHDGRRKIVPHGVKLPFEIGPELIENYYHFLTYNDGM